MAAGHAGTTLPTREAAWHRLVAAEPPAWVLRHCRCVEALAVAMARQAAVAGLSIDEELVARGALLHDIGRSRSQGIDHGRLGAEMLRAPPPLPEPVARIVETHMGAGLLPDEARAAGLPDVDYVPRTFEQKLVAHADNLYSGDKRLDIGAVVAKYESRGLAAAARRIVTLHEELCRALDADLERLAPATMPAIDPSR